MNFYFICEFRNTLKSFRFVSLCQNRRETENGAQTSKYKILKLTVVDHVLQTTQNLVISRCCFAEDGKEMYKDL